MRAALQPPVYRATTRILIEKAEVQNLAMANPLYSSWDPEFLRTQVQIIRSSATAERAARVVAAEERFRGRFSALASAPAGRREAPPPAPPALVKMILGGISAAPDKDSKIVTVSYLASEPELAAAIVTAVVKAYTEQLFDMKMSYSRSTVAWMTEKAREEAARLEDSERAVQTFLRANDLVTMENRVAVIPERLAELGLELTKAETRRRELEAVKQSLASAGSDVAAAEAIPVVQSDPGFQAVKGQLFKAEETVLDLAKKYGPKHPAMIAARQQVEALQAKKAAEIRRIASSLRTEHALALAREQDLRERLAKGRGEAVDANARLARYEELRRAAETNRQLYDTLMARAKEESLTQQLQGVQVWVLEPAEVPASPAGPRALRTVLLGLVAGLFGGVLMAFFVEYLDNTVRSPDDLELKTGVPVLGVIPLSRERSPAVESVVLREPRQHAAESFRALRTAILLSSREGPPKRILVTSTAPEEGKTATAVNLAVAIAHSGYSVLLVDADLRKPRVDKVFDIGNDQGLSTLLRTADPLPVPVDVGVENLAVLPSGPVPDNPSELLGSKRMDALLRDFASRYDILVLDSPPFLTVADGLVLAKKLDAVLFVTRAERSTYDQVRRGIKALRDIDVRPFGFVLNAYDEKRSGSYSYYHSYYGGGEAKPGEKPGEKRRRPRAGAG